MGYGLWIQKHCKQAWETQKCMDYKGVWVIPGMGYEKFDCTVREVIRGEDSPVEREREREEILEWKEQGKR